jgi:hypothetical protein
VHCHGTKCPLLTALFLMFFFFFSLYPFHPLTFGMTSEGLGEMFKGDFADMCAQMSTCVNGGCSAKVLVCADPGGRTPIGASRNLNYNIHCAVCDHTR